MQYHVSNYGVFSLQCAQVYAFDQNTSLQAASAVSAVYKALFTLGLNGQANTVSGVLSGKRYASNLKWAYSAMPTTDDQFHIGTTVSSGCSRGDSANNLDWSANNTVFISDSTGNKSWSYGTCYVTTGLHSPALTATVLLRNEVGTGYNVTRTGRVSFNSYLVNTAAQFKYIRGTSISVDASSYSYSLINGSSDMRMFADTTEADVVVPVDKYECIQNGKLFRFKPEELNFGQLVPGTRPKVQAFLTAKFDL